MNSTGMNTARLASVALSSAPQTSLGPVDRGLHRALAQLMPAIDVLQHDDRVIDEHADGEGQAAEAGTFSERPIRAITRNVPIVLIRMCDEDDDRRAAAAQEHAAA